MLQLICQIAQLTDVQPCLNKHANMTSVEGPRSESRSVIHRDWKTLLQSSANNMLTRPPYDVPRANFAVNHCITVLRRSLLPGAADLVDSLASPLSHPRPSGYAIYVTTSQVAPFSLDEETLRHAGEELRQSCIRTRREGLELKQVEHFEDDDDNDNDSDDVEDVSVHGSWITRRYPSGEQYVAGSREICPHFGTSKVPTRIHERKAVGG
jgi:sirohydrochlorin ferrochelatase